MECRRANNSTALLSSILPSSFAEANVDKVYNTTGKTIRRIGNLPRISMRNPVVNAVSDGKPLFELSHWRCGACGVSLFFADGSCWVCRGLVRIPRVAGQ